uniref:Actin-related protein 2/3 complex subunit 5 n=1 Tax=Tetraselmis sp. GSL018 TaxID=582737 RepID=A0A061SAW8_9CHLO|mmetsp:Transcript_30015/g.71533  ORF Transcript_30015/g.71533 Transcript_30015/m.71533 type:complete len:115 (+) Transcript_30015:457-801(+)
MSAEEVLSAIRSLVLSSFVSDPAACDSPPATSERQEASCNDYLEKVLKTISMSKDEEICKVVAALSCDEADVLMRAVYEGLSRGEAALSAKLFRWHEQLVGARGLGTVMRAMHR